MSIKQKNSLYDYAEKKKVRSIRISKQIEQENPGCSGFEANLSNQDFLHTAVGRRL